MTTIVRVRFDGKVLIPEDKVDLPTDRVIELRVENERQAAPEPKPAPGMLSDLAQWARSLSPLKDAPDDFAAQHDHYIHGSPKREDP